LGFDAFDVAYYAQLFAEKLGRDPTDVELYDMSQSNSEHSRHWFFSGRQVVDGVEKDQSLFRLVKATLSKAREKAQSEGREDSSVVAFSDNSSVIKGGSCRVLVPEDAARADEDSTHVGYGAAPLVERTRTLHALLTAETHNFPCAVAPFPGAETGAGGRLRDVQATGRGAHACAGVAGYCVGNLHLPDHAIAGEESTAKLPYPGHLATPSTILKDASDGASDYGNKFGEPLVRSRRPVMTRVHRTKPWVVSFSSLRPSRRVRETAVASMASSRDSAFMKPSSWSHESGHQDAVDAMLRAGLGLLSVPRPARRRYWEEGRMAQTRHVLGRRRLARRQTLPQA